MNHRLWGVTAALLAAALCLPAGAQDDEGFPLFVAVDRTRADLSLSKPSLVSGFGAQDLKTDFYVARVGTRLAEHYGFELQYGVADSDGEDPGEAKLGRYFAVYFAPSTTLEGLFEIGTLIGYSGYQVKRGAADAGFKGVAYGVRVDLPLRLYAESAPDLRIGGGYMVYGNDRDGRLYGWQLGLRYDFRI